MTSLSDTDIRALQYIENAGHIVQVADFDHDHEPIGPMLRRNLVPEYLSVGSDGMLRLTEDGMALIIG